MSGEGRPPAVVFDPPEGVRDNVVCALDGSGRRLGRILRIEMAGPRGGRRPPVHTLDAALSMSLGWDRTLDGLHLPSTLDEAKRTVAESWDGTE